MNKVEICGVNTSKLQLLDEKEKRELFEKIRQGDEAAKERYIKGNLRLVLSVMKRFGASSENPDDLFQIGCIGLIKAIDKFDYHIIKYPDLLFLVPNVPNALCVLPFLIGLRASTVPMALIKFPIPTHHLQNLPALLHHKVLLQ